MTFVRYSLYIQFTFVRHSSLVSTITPKFKFNHYLFFVIYSNSYFTFVRYSLYIQFTFVRHSSLVSTTICLSIDITIVNRPLLDIHYTFSSHSLDIQVWCQPLPPNSNSTTIFLSLYIQILTWLSLDIRYTFSSHSLPILVWFQPIFVCL